MKDLFARYVESPGDSAALPSKTTQQRTPLKLQELKKRGADMRGIRYLVPEDQDGKSTNPCLVIHEERLPALLALERGSPQDPDIHQRATVGPDRPYGGVGRAGKGIAQPAGRIRANDLGRLRQVPLKPLSTGGTDEGPRE